MLCFGFGGSPGGGAVPTLQFKGKSVIETYHHTVPHHRLEFDPKLSLLPKGERPGLDGNLIIEGDNLLALKALLPTHAGKVKCIYIDPPYNTGNEGWVYNQGQRTLNPLRHKDLRSVIAGAAGGIVTLPYRCTLVS